MQTPEHVKEYNKRYYALHKKEICDQKKKYHILNKKRICDRLKEYRSQNKEKIKLQVKKYYAISSDYYIRLRLRRLMEDKKSTCKFSPELIELKRKTLSLKRTIKQIKEQGNAEHNRAV